MDKGKGKVITELVPPSDPSFSYGTTKKLSTLDLVLNGSQQGIIIDTRVDSGIEGCGKSQSNDNSHVVS